MKKYTAKVGEASTSSYEPGYFQRSSGSSSTESDILVKAIGELDSEGGLSNETILAIAESHYKWKGDSIILGVDSVHDLKSSVNQLKDNIGKVLVYFINRDSDHWVTLVVAYLEGKRCAFYMDSLGEKISDELKEEFPDAQNLSFLQQRDSHSCGVFALANAEIILNNIEKGSEVIKQELHQCCRPKNKLKQKVDKYKKSLQMQLSKAGQDFSPVMMDEYVAEVQDFELIQLLIQEAYSATKASTSTPTQEENDPNRSFTTRMQSLINQIPSYLHSVEKKGFFTHFFFGSFSTLLGTQIARKLGVKKIYFRFDDPETLKVVVVKDGKDTINNIALFSILGPRSKSQGKFTFGELKSILEKLVLTKKRSNLDKKAEAMKDRIKSKSVLISKTKEVISINTKDEKIVDKSKGSCIFYEIEEGLWQDQEDAIHPLSPDSEEQQQEEEVKYAVQDILKAISTVHFQYEDQLAYHKSAREAAHHGFLAGVFMNFRYRYNIAIRLEQLSGPGYADIVLLVRGPGRALNAIPIVIEVKAASSQDIKSLKELEGKLKKLKEKSGKLTLEEKNEEKGIEDKIREIREKIEDSLTDGLRQAIQYGEGFQRNARRVLTRETRVACISVNLDSLSNPVSEVKVVEPGGMTTPFFQDMLEYISKCNNDKTTNKEESVKLIRDNMLNICQTFTGTAGINNHYSSRFLLGQLLLLHEALGTNFEKYIFIYDEDENIPVEIRSKSRNRDVAQRRAANLADKKLAGLTELDQSHAVVTVVFIPKDAKESVYIINIVEADGREILSKGVPLSNLSREIGKREIVEVNLNFNVKERKLKFKDHFDIEFTKPVSLEVYNEQRKDKFKDGFHPIPYSNKLKEAFDEAIESQRVPTQGQSSVSEKQAQSVLKGYSNLFNEIGNAVFHFISIITGELQFQAVLHGAFSHYSDIRQKSGEGQMLVVVQFQSGSQGIIDIAVTCIGSGNSGAERFYPVLSELKMRETGSEVSAQIESRIARGAACKMLTDETLTFIMGIVFNNKARSPDGIYTVTEPKILNVPHSSALINPSKEKGDYKLHPKKLVFGKRGIPYWIFVEVDVPYWVSIERNQAEGLGLRDSCIILESDQDIKQYLERSTTGSKTLDLFNTCLNNSLIETLVEFLSTQKVDVLDLSFNELESEGVKKLIDALVNSKRTVSFLNLSDNIIGSNGSESGAISSLARLIENNNIVHLAISDVAMTPNDFSKIFYALKNNTSIEKLDLSQNKIEGGFNEEIVGVMVDILYRHPTLTVLDLSNTGITDNTIKSIVEKAEKDCAEEMQPNIKNLYIREGEITEEGMESLVKFVTQAKKLESLSLSGNPIGTGVDKLIDMLKDTNISTLELCNISLRCDKSNTKNIAKMMADLIDRSKVKILDLSYNDLNVETIEKIFSTISSRKEKMLEKLYLSGNEIEEKEQAGLPSAISKSLTNNNVVESLGLADMCIYDNVLGEVVFKLEGSNIRDLDISGNDIGGATIEALSNYLIRKDTVLEYLNIADYTDEDKTCPLYKNIKDLFKVLEENETLTHLDISNYVLDSDSINAISEYLSNEKANLSYLDLSKSELTDPLTQMKTLFSALEKNDKLQHLYLLDIKMTDEIADVIIAHRKENRKSKIFTSEGQLSNGKKKELRDLSVEVISSLPDVKKGVKNTQEGKFDEDKVSRKMDELGKSLSGSRQFMDHGKRPNTTVDVPQAEAPDEKKRKFL